LFEKNKDLKNLFHSLTRVEADGEVVLDEEKLRTHSRIVMDGLGAAVESLEDSVILTNILILMGERHATYNVQPEMVSVSITVVIKSDWIIKLRCEPYFLWNYDIA
jgi:hypothetical protein